MSEANGQWLSVQDGSQAKGQLHGRTAGAATLSGAREKGCLCCYVSQRNVQAQWLPASGDSLVQRSFTGSVVKRFKRSSISGQDTMSSAQKLLAQAPPLSQAPSR